LTREDPRWCAVEGSRNPERHYFRKILQSRGSYTWVILIFLLTKLPPAHGVHIRFNNQPLKHLFIAHNSQEVPGEGWNRHSHLSASGESHQPVFLFFFFFIFSLFFLEKAED
jgi:hypothetical protein